MNKNTEWKIKNIDFDDFDHIMVKKAKEEAAATEAVVEGEEERKEVTD